MEKIISGNIIDIINGRIFPGILELKGGKIEDIKATDSPVNNNYILPALIDSHVHIESSMLVPSEFARLAVVHGTVATVSDPHEIANVLGMEGVKFMLENGRSVPFKFFFGAPSCVPATGFESSGASISVGDIRNLLADPDIKYLSEMMNFPGVINDQPDVIAKLKLAREFNKPVDGHAPLLRSDMLQKYVSAGITTDHEASTLGEATEKILLGMKILIREGSAARNFESLYPLIDQYPESCMLCSDDKHPDDLIKGHINLLIKRAVAKGIDLMNVLRAAVLNPIRHYNLDVGLLCPGDDADFIIVDDLINFRILETYIKGQLVAKEGKCLIDGVHFDPPNKFFTSSKHLEDFIIPSAGKPVRVIKVLDGELITDEIAADETIENDYLVSDVIRDILKIAVINRYEDTRPAIAFVNGFGLKKGAIAGSVGHDSHNIIAVGTNDIDLCRAVNLVIKNKGGLVAACGEFQLVLSLPVAGLMSIMDGHTVANQYLELDRAAKEFGSTLAAPFMTLSFMALLVIPKLKLSDKGLFDAINFRFVDLHYDQL